MSITDYQTYPQMICIFDYRRSGCFENLLQLWKSKYFANIEGHVYMCCKSGFFTTNRYFLLQKIKVLLFKETEKIVSKNLEIVLSHRNNSSFKSNKQRFSSQKTRVLVRNSRSISTLNKTLRGFLSCALAGYTWGDRKKCSGSTWGVFSGLEMDKDQIFHQRPSCVNKLVIFCLWSYWEYMSKEVQWLLRWSPSVC